jgi:hypothetical protein
VSGRIRIASKVTRLADFTSYIAIVLPTLGRKNIVIVKRGTETTVVTPTTGLKARIAGGAAIIDSARSPITH